MILIHVLLLLLWVLLVIVNLLFVHDLVLLMLQLVDVLSQLLLSLIGDNTVDQLVVVMLFLLFAQLSIQLGQLSIDV